MTDLDQTLRDLVLGAISDDYEDIERVLEEVTADHGFTSEREAVLKALEGLIKDGYAQAYLLSSGPPAGAEAVDYAADRASDLWFYVTPKGKELARQLQQKWR